MEEGVIIPIQQDQREVMFYASPLEDGIIIAISDEWEGKRKVCFVQLDKEQAERLKEVL
jgi:hypothetical protein